MSLKEITQDSDKIHVADHSKRKSPGAKADEAFEAPRILRDPTSRQVVLGGRLSMRITASGKPLPSYQWFLNGKKIIGANSDRLVINHTRREHCGAFTCEARNLAGSAVSRAAMVSFLPDQVPEIIVEPVVASIPVGSPFKFRIASPGPESLKHFTLQWVLNGKKIKNAHGPELQFTQVKAKYEGEYKVLVLAGGDIHASNCVTLKALPAQSPPAVEPALTREKTALIARPPKEDFFFDPLAEEYEAVQVESPEETFPEPEPAGEFPDPFLPAESGLEAMEHLPMPEELESFPLPETLPEEAAVPELPDFPLPEEPFLGTSSDPELPAMPDHSPANPAPTEPALNKKRHFLQRLLQGISGDKDGSGQGPGGKAA